LRSGPKGLEDRPACGGMLLEGALPPVLKALWADLSRLNFIPDCVILIENTARFEGWA